MLLILILLVPAQALAYYSGEPVMIFEDAECMGEVQVLVTPLEDPPGVAVEPGEYELLDCDEQALNNWVCSCSVEMFVEPDVIRDYSIKVLYYKPGDTQKYQRPINIQFEGSFNRIGADELLSDETLTPPPPSEDSSPEKEVNQTSVPVPSTPTEIVENETINETILESVTEINETTTVAEETTEPVPEEKEEVAEITEPVQEEVVETVEKEEQPMPDYELLTSLAKKRTNSYINTIGAIALTIFGIYIIKKKNGDNNNNENNNI